MAENIIEQSTGEKTDVDIEDGKVTIESDSMKAVIESGAKIWPEAIPGDVPVFAWGTVVHTTFSTIEDVTTWGVHFENVPVDALGKYDSELKKSGFRSTKVTMGKGGMVTAEKDKLLVTATVGENKGYVSVQQRE